MTRDELREKCKRMVGGERIRVKVQNPFNEWTFEGGFLGVNYTECVLRILCVNGKQYALDYRRILEITEVK